MARANSNQRLRRLELLAVQLKQEGLCTIRDLARQHEVSERTIARDLLLMREQGLPIDADRGRGGGVRLDSNWGVGRLNLSYPDAVDLLVSIAVAEQMNTSIFLSNLASVKRQLIASFSPDKRSRVTRLKSRILIGVTASTFVQSNAAPLNDRIIQSLHQAFVDQVALDIRYQDESGVVSERRVEPHYLLLNYPVWYVLAFDHLKNAPRTFRCDRILAAKATGTRFQVRPREDFSEALDGNDILK